MLCFACHLHAQGQEASGDFWSRVRFGGAVGASFGSNYTDLMLAPGALYSFNDYFAAGVGLQGSYVRVKNEYDSWMYGASVIGIVSPVEEIQFSVELEQLRVNNTFSYVELPEEVHDDFWNTALYLGLGYSTGDVTIGVRYNLLFDEDKFVYNEAFMPFVRVYF
jgi:hypothetical protein